MASSGRTPTEGKPPGKLRSQGTQTRDRIVAAAAELMFEGGVARTTMDMVRAAGRVSSSQIYHYVADKETLVRAVIDYHNDTIVGGQEPMLATLDSLDGIRAWRAFVVEHEHQHQLCCRGGCPIGELGPDVSPDQLATTTLAALQRGLLLGQVQRSTEPLEVALDTVNEYVDYVSSLTVPVPP